jgi:hypothetical protein
MSVELIGVFAAFATNVITILKISSVLEKRVQKTETVINQVIRPQMLEIKTDLKEVKAILGIIVRDSPKI